MNRGVGGMRLFADDREFALFLNLFEQAKREFQFIIHAFCLMPNHFHFLIEVCEDLLSDFIGDVEERYARYFNRTRSRLGYVYQGRFKALDCSDPSYYLNVLRYIENNPVKGGLVPRCGDWPWASYKQIIASTPYSLIDRERVLERFASAEDYRDWVAGPAETDAVVAFKTFPSATERSLFNGWADAELNAVLERLVTRIAGAGGR